jgi:hypothetical protein
VVHSQMSKRIEVAVDEQAGERGGLTGHRPSRPTGPAEAGLGIDKGPRPRREVGQLKAKTKVMQLQLNYAHDRISDINVILSTEDQSGWVPSAGGGRKRVVSRRPSLQAPDPQHPRKYKLSK